MRKLLPLFLSLLLTLPSCTSGLDLNPLGGLTSSAAGYQPGGAEGTVGDTLHTYWFDFTVTDAYAAREYAGYEAQEGYRLIVADISLRSTFGEDVPMYDSDFILLWNEEDYDFPLPAWTQDQFPEEYTLSPGEEVRGIAVYEVPETDHSQYGIVFLEYFEDESEGDSYLVSFTAAEKT